ncbi:uncharacterized protein SPSK_10025 [Sporothrix schenckii 1099-18]|uniref:Uncharacterized protein n=1 Tax=Sporothrix schenckii 1099-18 TaxID=1397361 RepID=A0A0F2M5H9_SPOSC|nr:uncharacterized protein SPSK_10025 [Sporothrix schenckii 1099-18]KJR84943.1 hypothetical protein SPSK_10025 [Sporothrix schenckii 1099-18]
MSTSWPLLSPVRTAPASQGQGQRQPSRPTTAGSRPATMTTVATFGSGTTTTTITAGTPTRPKRLSGPAKDAREDYHDFIGTVEKSTKQTVFSEQQRKRRRAQRLPVGTTRLFDHGRMRLIPVGSKGATIIQ